MLAVLQPIWRDKAATAEKVQSHIAAVLDSAKARGHPRGDNPARWKGHLDQLLPRRNGQDRRHHEALPYADLPEFFARLAAKGGMGALALQFTILTAASEARMLKALLDNPHRVLSREDLVEIAFFPGASPSRSAVDLRISRLRKRLGAQGFDIIRTCRRGGFRLSAEVVVERPAPASTINSQPRLGPATDSEAVTFLRDLAKAHNGTIPHAPGVAS